MIAPTCTFLAVDDEPRALALLRSIVEPDGHHLITAPDGQTALALAEQMRPDAVLLDVMMPDLDGFEVCRRLHAMPELATLPILLLTALDDRASRLEGLSAGADDFITKPFDSVELRLRLRTLRQLNRYRRLYEESSRYEAAITHSAEGLVLAERDGTILLRNPAFDRLLTPAGRTITRFFEYFEDPAPLQGAFADGRTLPPTELPLLHSAVTPTYVEIGAGLVPWEGRTIVQYHIRDLTEKRSLEAQLLRSQRIELLGQLSGSLVHDMNNLLSAIGGSATLLQLDPQGPNRDRQFETIQKAIATAASMMRQLLMFARGADGPLEPVFLPEAINAMASLVESSLGPRFKLGLEVPADLPMVLGDHTQINQMVMNLCVNARDAMPQGGQITIAAFTRDCQGAELAGAGPDAKPGQYVVLAVRDTGTGIPPEVKARLFDPFFTTKPAGKGTGLGLATVLRLARRHGGFVTVETAVGRGTTFFCHFPVPPDA
jgi:two-component system cell cycle sensor histidine kinase/response regulator CckA